MLIYDGLTDRKLALNLLQTSISYDFGIMWDELKQIWSHMRKISIYFHVLIIDTLHTRYTTRYTTRYIIISSKTYRDTTRYTRYTNCY